MVNGLFLNGFKWSTVEIFKMAISKILDFQR